MPRMVTVPGALSHWDTRAATGSTVSYICEGGAGRGGAAAERQRERGHWRWCSQVHWMGGWEGLQVWGGGGAGTAAVRPAASTRW